MRLARLTLALAAVLGAAAPAAMAAPISYSYVDARYFSTDTDAVSVNQRGGLLTASLGLGDFLYVQADGNYAESERFTAGTATGRIESYGGIGRLGAHFAVTPTLDLLANGGGVYAKARGTDGFSGSNDDWGYTVQLGTRIALLERVEVGAFYNYTDIDDSEFSDFTADLQFHVVESVSLVGSVTNGRNRDEYSVGARFRF